MLRSPMSLFRCDLIPVCRLDIILVHPIAVKGHLPKAAYRLWVFEEVQVIAKAV